MFIVSVHDGKIMSKKTGRKIYRWRSIALPVILTFIVMAVLVLAIALPGSPFRLYNRQLAIVGETLIMVMILCPLVICMIIPYALLVGMIFVMQKTHHLTETGLTRARELTHTAALKGVELADTASQKSIGINTRFAFLNHMFESRTDERTERSQLEKSDLPDGNR